MTVPPIAELRDKQISIMQRVRLTGLSQNASKILTFLMVHGTASAKQLYEGTAIAKTETYDYLKMLAEQNYIEIVCRADGNQYRANPLSEIIDNLIVKQQQIIQNLKQIQPDIQSIQLHIPSRPPQEPALKSDGVIQPIAGRKSIIIKCEKILQHAQKSIKLLCTKEIFFKLYHQDVFDIIAAKKLSTKIKSQQSIEKIKTIKLQNAPPLSMLLVDDCAALIIFEGLQMSAIYTTNKALVQMMLYTFQLAA